MSDHEPSDPSGAWPINRLLTIWDPPQEPSIRQLLLEALNGEPSVTLDRDEEEAICRAVDHPAIYRAAYAVTRAEIASGYSPEQIRAGVRGLTAGDEKTAATVNEAVEDALMGKTLEAVRN